jgi:enoyl-CoA hydratase/carnithine racemase
MHMPQTFEGLLEERDGAVLHLTIDRPGDLNRLSPELVNYLMALVGRLREDPDTHVVVISGSGDDFFSMGLLNPVIRASLSKDDVIKLVRRANALFDALESLPQIVIACINGKVLAGAVELCLACDLRYAASHVTLQMPEAAWGGFPGAGAPVRLPMLVGRARALELMCTARQIDSAEMNALALVQGVYPKETVRQEVGRIAQQIAGNGPLAVRGAKRIMAVRQEPGSRAARELSDALRHALEWSHDVDEGLAAHQQNRQPRFKGR